MRVLQHIANEDLQHSLRAAAYTNERGFYQKSTRPNHPPPRRWYGLLYTTRNPLAHRRLILSTRQQTHLQDVFQSATYTTFKLPTLTMSRVDVGSGFDVCMQVIEPCASLEVRAWVGGRAGGEDRAAVRVCLYVVRLLTPHLSPAGLLLGRLRQLQINIFLAG